MEHNSSKNQAIKGKLVDRHVLYCQSSVVEEMLSKEMVSFEDISNTDRYEVELSSEWFEGSYQEKEEKVQELKDTLDPIQDELWDKETDRDTEEDPLKVENLEGEIEKLQEQVDDLESGIYLLENADSTYPEILEWWLVDSWLFDRLNEEGECTLEEFGSQWWGRTCSGQAIMLDSCISSICERMEYLEGQKREWEV